jgi:hypothetical protein
VERGKDSRGDNLAVYRDGGAHCFSCSFHRFSPVSRRWEVKVDHEKENKVKRILPDDFSWDVPSRAWEWLLQYSLPYDYWKGIVGWSEKYQRLVFRVGDPLQFSQGRSFHTALNSNGPYRKWHLWGDSHQSVTSIGKGSTSILVEDLISAHKVSQVGHVICLFGTRIYPIHIKYLREQKKDINIWLDNDQGEYIPNKAANLSILTGCKVNIINTQKDPKEYNVEEISNYISSVS